MKVLQKAVRSANSLRVFESAARNLSFTHAALELHVTQVAVSRMVARLEDSLGLVLFIRSRAGLQLTEDGSVLYAAVAEGFGKIEGALKELKRRQSSRDTVTLSLSNGFVSHWLMPRYSRFQQAVPGINLRFEVTGAILQGDVDGVDMGMRMHAPGQALQSWHFCPEVILPLCSPGYLAGTGPIDPPADLGGHTLVHLTSTTMSWEAFCLKTGLKYSPKSKSLSFSDSALVLQGALLGQGVVLGWLSAVSGVLSNGILVPASERIISTGRAYHLVAKPGPLREEVHRVREWLVSEIQSDFRAIESRFDFLKAHTAG